MAGADALSRQQVRDTLSSIHNVRDKALFLFGFQTGFRIAELLSLTIADVCDSVGNIKPIVTVTKSRMKGKRQPRTVRLSLETQAILGLLVEELESKNRARRTDAVFQSRQGRKGLPLGTRRVNDIVKRTFVSIGAVGRFSTHSFRKTFAEECRRIFSGDILKIQRALGHADIRATLKYLDYQDKEVMESVGNISYG
jgi:integrase